MHQQRFLEQRGFAVGQLRQRPRRRRHQVTVKGKSTRHRDQLDELPFAGAFREIKLRGKRHLGRYLAADAAKIRHRLLVKGLARRHREVRPQQRFRLQLDRAAQVFTHRSDPGERGDPEDDRQRKQRQPPPRGPRIPPRHFEDEVHAEKEEWPTEHTEDTEKSEREPLMLDQGEVPEIHQQPDSEPGRIEIILHLRAMLVGDF